VRRFSAEGERCCQHECLRALKTTTIDDDDRSREKSLKKVLNNQ
jgi:hypothetical protein